MPLISWMLCGAAGLLAVVVYTLPWLSIMTTTLKRRGRSSTPEMQAAQLAAELHALEAKYPPREDRS